MPRRSKYEGKFKKYQVFGEWTVIQPKIHLDDRGRAFVRCRCSCEAEEMVSCHHLISGRSTRCKTCNYNLREFNKNPHWRGIGETPASIITKASSSAAASNKPFYIDTNYANTLYEDSNKTCMFTGMSISHQDDTARLIELDKERGYVEGNVAWVHKSMEPLLRSTSPNELIQLCAKMAKHYKPQEESNEQDSNSSTTTEKKEED